MNLPIGLKLIGVVTAVFLLAACETTPEETADTSGQGASSQSASSQQGGVTSGQLQGGQQGPAAGSQEDLALNVGDRVFFGFDEYTLTDEARSTLERMAAWLRRYPNVELVIEGHADERGTREYNLALGERRANSVKDYLATLGVSPARLTTISYGSERPVAIEHNEAAWAQNRRAVAVIQ